MKNQFEKFYVMGYPVGARCVILRSLSRLTDEAPPDHPATDEKKK
jgi:hypothetical protein